MQSDVLNDIRRSKHKVSVYLANGVRLSGAVIESFDSYVLELRVGGEVHLVYKSSVATVLPETAATRNAVDRPRPAKEATPLSAPSVVVKTKRRRIVPDGTQ